MEIAQGYRCRDIAEFNALLFDWLVTTHRATVGSGTSRNWVTVRIGDIDCELAADTARIGVERYLKAVLSASDPLYVVVASSKGVIERVSIGHTSERIPGFYMYTRAPFEAARPLGRGVAHSEPEFTLVDVAILLLEAVGILHVQGYQRLRILPGLSGSGLHWRTTVTLADNFTRVGSNLTLRDYESGFFWTTGDGFQIGRMRVADLTTAEDVSRILAEHFRGAGYGPDPAYAHWYEGLVAAARSLKRLPIAYKDWVDDDPGWELDGHLRYSAPPDPV